MSTFASVVQISRRLLLGLGAAFVLAFAVANVLTGRASAMDMLLYAAPFVAIIGLLLSGRYVGEERILAVYPRCSAPAGARPGTPAAEPRTALQRRAGAGAVVLARTARPRHRLTQFATVSPRI